MNTYKKYSICKMIEQIANVQDFIRYRSNEIPLQDDDRRTLQHLLEIVIKDFETKLEE